MLHLQFPLSYFPLNHNLRSYFYERSYLQWRYYDYELQMLRWHMIQHDAYRRTCNRVNAAHSTILLKKCYEWVNPLKTIPSFRSNCHSKVATVLRQHYNRPYFLPVDSKSSRVDWIFMGGPGPGAFVHVSVQYIPTKCACYFLSFFILKENFLKGVHIFQKNKLCYDKQSIMPLNFIKR